MAASISDLSHAPQGAAIVFCHTRSGLHQFRYWRQTASFDDPDGVGIAHKLKRELVVAS
jgi:hypothetical protein